MLAQPFWLRRTVLRTAESATTNTKPMWRTLPSAHEPARPAPRRSGALRASEDPGAIGWPAVCGREFIWSAALLRAGSSGKRRQEAIEVVLVVPRPDRRPQPGSIG